MQLESNLYPIAPSRSPTLTKISSYKLHCNSSMFSHFFLQPQISKCRPTCKVKGNESTESWDVSLAPASPESEDWIWASTLKLHTKRPEVGTSAWTPVGMDPVCWEAKMIHLLFYCGYIYPFFIHMMHLVAPGNAGHVGTDFFFGDVKFGQFCIPRHSSSRSLELWHWDALDIIPNKRHPLSWRSPHQEVPLQTPHGIWDILRKPHFPHATRFGGVLVWWIRFHYLESLSRARDGSPHRQITGDGSFRAFCFWCSCSLW